MKSIKISFGDLDTGNNYGLFLGETDGKKFLDVFKVEKDKPHLKHLNVTLHAVSIAEKNSSADFFARNLRHFRKMRGLSVAELAEKSGLSKPEIQKIETGWRSPTIKTVQLLADALHIPITDLFYSV